MPSFRLTFHASPKTDLLIRAGYSVNQPSEFVKSAVALGIFCRILMEVSTIAFKRNFGDRVRKVCEALVDRVLRVKRCVRIEDVFPNRTLDRRHLQDVVPRVWVNSPLILFLS